MSRRQLNRCVGALARAQAGFSMVELILVIVIIGIMASVAGPRFFGSTEFDERAYRDEVATTLRYAQKVAVASGCPVRVALDTSGYALTQQAELAGHCDPADTSYPVPVLLANGQLATGSAPAGLTIGPPVEFRYDAAGRTNLAGDQVIAVGARTLVVRAASGLVLTP